MVPHRDMNVTGKLMSSVLASTKSKEMGSNRCQHESQLFLPTMAEEKINQPGKQRLFTMVDTTVKIVHLFYRHRSRPWKADSEQNQWYSERVVVSRQNINPWSIRSFTKTMRLTIQTLSGDSEAGVSHRHHYLVPSCDLSVSLLRPTPDRTRSNISVQCLLNHLSWYILQFVHKSVNLLHMVSTTASDQPETISMAFPSLGFDLDA